MKATDNLFVSVKILGPAAVALKHLVDNASSDQISAEDVSKLTVEDRDAITLFLTLIAPVKKVEPAKKHYEPVKSTKYVNKAGKDDLEVRIKK